MKFEWDEAKNIINITKHGFDLGYGAYVFSDPCVIDFLDTRKDYGEERRIANKKERKLYYGNSKNDS